MDIHSKEPILDILKEIRDTLKIIENQLSTTQVWDNPQTSTCNTPGVTLYSHPNSEAPQFTLFSKEKRGSQC